MNLTILESSKDLIVIELEGSLDVAGAQSVETRFLAHTSTATCPVILDFSKVTFLASFGLRMLFDAFKSLQRKGKKLVILNPQPIVAQVLDMADVGQLIMISHDAGDARAKAGV